MIHFVLNLNFHFMDTLKIGIEFIRTNENGDGYKTSLDFHR